MGAFSHSPRRRKGLTRRVFLLAALVAAVLSCGLPAGMAQGIPAEPAPTPLEWEQWFYGQRTYGLGYIPDEALTRAVFQRDGQRDEQRDTSRTGTGLSKLGTGYRTLATDSPPEAESDAWVSLGPGGIISTRGDMVSGRVTSLAIDPRNSSTVYAAAAGGGVTAISKAVNFESGEVVKNTNSPDATRSENRMRICAEGAIATVC